MSPFDPPRIASGRANVPESLCNALQSAATDGPTPHEFSRLAAALAPLLVAPPSPSAYPGIGNGLSESASLGGKILGAGFGKGATILAVAVGCAAGGYGFWRSVRSGGTGVPDDIAPAPLSQPAAPFANRTPIPVEQLPLETAPVEESVTTIAPARPRTHVVEAPLPVPSAQESPAQIEAPKAEISESELVELARRSVAQDPRKALSLVQDHQRRFAGGPLSEEADFLEIESLKRLGRSEEARLLDERFRKRYPSSLHGQTVRIRPAPTP
jgi:hypothetical protein